MVFVLLGVLGQLALLDALRGAGFHPPELARLALLIGPAVLAPIGEMLAVESARWRVQRAGLWITLAASAVSLALDLGCLALPWSIARWEVPLASVVPSALVMGGSLAFAARSLAVGRVLTHREDLASPPRSFSHAVLREAWLFGGTAIALITVSLAFVAMALVGLARAPDAWVKLTLSGGFFAACALVGARMGLDRRAALLSVRSPAARP